MKQFRRRMIATGLAVSISLCSVQTLKVFASSDVSNDYFAKPQIDKFISEGIINGYPDGTFKPNNSITRAEFVKIINKAFGFTKVGTKSFKDIKEDAWYTNDIKIAVEKGYINGFEDNTFRPNEEITREQMAKILGVILNVSGDGKTNFLDDSKIAPWAKKYVDGLADKNLLSGYPDKTFKPKGNATRGESVSLISNSEDYFEGNKDNNTSNGNGNTSSGGNTSTGGGSNNGSNGGDTSTGGGNNNGSNTGDGTVDSNQGNTVEVKPEATPSEIQDILNNSSKPIVKVTNTNLENLTIPSGKVLLVEGTSTINGNIDVSEGKLQIDGNVTLKENALLSTTTKSRARTYSLRTVEPKIVGKGKIDAFGGSIQVNDVNELKTDVEVNSNSTIKVNNTSVVGKDNNNKITINDGNTNLLFDFNSDSVDGIYTTVNGNVTLNENISEFVFKSKEEGSVINLPKKKVGGNFETVSAYLDNNGVKRKVNGGAYKFNNSSWEDFSRPLTVKPTVEKTTAGTIIPGHPELTAKIGVSRDISPDRYNKETTMTILDKSSNPMDANVFDADKVDEFRVLINLGQDKQLAGLKLNGASFDITGENISDEIKPGDLVTINFVRKDYDNSYINLKNNGDILDVTAVEYTAQIEEEKTKVETVLSNEIVSSVNSTTAGTITTTSDTLQNNDTTVEFLIGGNSVTSFDLDKVNADNIDVRIDLGKDKTLKQVLLNSVNLTELPKQIQNGSVVTITLTKEELSSLMNKNDEKFVITVVE